MSTALIEAALWADELMEAETKSRREKEYVIRDRLAGKIGVSASYLFRLQYKIETMNDVKGSVYRALLKGRELYGLVCERTEAAADALEARRLGTKANNHAVTQGSQATGEGTFAGRD
ncbi:hypothetical protein C1M53_31520 [Mesorhizobium sp. Pch-S]|nr:hypothetical protein C1M53_31520 [Mesorhizobium sp. Pch-S]